MDNQGTFKAQIYTSRARLPIKDAVVTVLTARVTPQTILAHRMTNSSGNTEILYIDTPAIGLSQSPGNALPFTSVDVKITHPEFYSMLIRDVQIFSDTETIQQAELIPIEETKNKTDMMETVNITPQNL